MGIVSLEEKAKRLFIVIVRILIAQPFISRYLVMLSHMFMFHATAPDTLVAAIPRALASLRWPALTCFVVEGNWPLTRACRARAVLAKAFLRRSIVDTVLAGDHRVHVPVPQCLAAAPSAG